MRCPCEIAVVWVGQACGWRNGTFRRAYDLVIDTWLAAGMEPNRLAASAPGVGKQYGSFRQKRRYLERADFGKVGSVDIARVMEDCRYETAEWVMTADLSQMRNRFCVGCVPSILPAGCGVIKHNAEELLALSNCRYGFKFRQPLSFGPIYYAFNLVLYVNEDWRHNDLHLNIQCWDTGIDRLNPYICAGILRDIFPENYLSQPHLGARLGRTSTTLKEWIEGDPAGRGVFEPFTDTLTKWTPPDERIPLRDCFRTILRVT